MVLLLLFTCHFCEGSVLVCVLVCITLCPIKFCNHLDEEEMASCFAFIVFGISCYCKYYVASPHGAMGWSAVCDCGISWSYPLTFWVVHWQHTMNMTDSLSENALLSRPFYKKTLIAGTWHSCYLQDNHKQKNATCLLSEMICVLD